MRQEVCIFYICPSLFLQTKGDTYPEQRPQGKAGDGEDGEGHDVDECVMYFTDVSVGRLSCFISFTAADQSETWWRSIPSDPVSS